LEEVETMPVALYVITCRVVDVDSDAKSTETLAVLSSRPDLAIAAAMRDLKRRGYLPRAAETQAVLNVSEPLPVAALNETLGACLAAKLTVTAEMPAEPPKPKKDAKPGD